MSDHSSTKYLDAARAAMAESEIHLALADAALKRYPIEIKDRAWEHDLSLPCSVCGAYAEGGDFILFRRAREVEVFCPAHVVIARERWEIARQLPLVPAGD